MRLTPDLASSFARLTLAGVTREFPHKLDHVLYGAGDALRPKALHPAFYGCYDWHSAVHSHWTMVRLLRRFPELPEAASMHAVLADHLSREKLAQEAAYAMAAGRASFERPYGWAWLLKLAQELHEWPNQDAKAWSANIRTLAAHFAACFIDWLPRQRYPIRVGVHSNTAFALGLALDYARSVGDGELAAAIEVAARRFYAQDRAAPALWEPNGNDFLSPALVEADLMRRVLARDEFRAWFAGWLPGAASGEPKSLFEPVEATDRLDGQGVHLDGLNLSRAWCLAAVANVRNGLVPPEAAERHLAKGLLHVESGDFLGEHWLATFAVYALTA